MQYIRSVRSRFLYRRSTSALGAGAAVAFLALLLAACSSDRSPTSLGDPHAAALSISAQIIATGSTELRVTSSFTNKAGQPQELTPPQIVALSGGADSIALRFDITRCLTSGGASVGGCVASFEFQLVRGATILDRQPVGPLTLRANALTTVSTPIVLREVARVQIDSLSGNFSAPDVRDTVLMRAVATDVANTPVAAKTVAWASSDPTIASVRIVGGDSAALTALNPGSVTVTATVGGRAATVVLNIRPAQISKVVVTPPVVAAVVGDRTQLAVSVTDKYGVQLPAPPVSFSSSDASVAAVDSLGFVSALAKGTAIITASTGTKSGSATVNVSSIVVASVTPSLTVSQLEVGDQTTATATALDQRNRPIVSPAIVWLSSSPAVATVDARTGRVVGVSVGTTDIVATVGAVSGRVVLRVVPAAPASITVSPDSISISVLGTTNLTAAVRDRRGALLAGQPVRWQSLQPAVATVGATGTVTGVSAGTAFIVSSLTTATGTLSDTSTITVVQGGNTQIISIDSVGTSTPVNIGNVSGVIEVDVSYSANSGTTATSLRLFLGKLLVQTIVPSAATCPSQRCTFRVNTAAFDSSTGIGLLSNGPQDLRSELVVTSGVVPSNIIRLTLNNSNGFFALVSNVSTNPGFPATFVDPASGRTWIAGDVTLVLRGVNYTSGQSYARVSGQFLGQSFVDVPLVGGAASILFQNAAGALRSIAGYQTTAAGGDSVLLSAATLSGGGAGATQLLPTFVPIRVDNVAPTGGAFVLTLPVGTPTWLNGAYAFANGITPPQDAGAGMPTRVVPAIQVTGCGLTVWRAAGATAAQVGQCATNNTSTAYQARAMFTDQLGNAVVIPLQPSFGVDLTPPSLVFTTGSYADSSIVDLSVSITPRAPSFDVIVADAGSGVARTERFVSTLSKTGSGCLLGTGSPGPRPITNSACGFAQGASAYTLPTSQYGYFRYSVRAIDFAGNVSAVVSRVVLLDGGIPSVTNLAVSSPVANSPMQMTVSTTDDAEVRNLAAMVQYPDLQQIYNADMLGYGVAFNSAPWDDALALSVAPITLQAPFIRYLETVDVTTDTVRIGVTGGTPPLMRFFATDYLTNSGFALSALSNIPPGVPWFLYNARNQADRVNSFVMVPSISVAPTTGVKAEVRTTVSSTTPPFQRVDFFAFVPWPNGFNSSALCYIGSTNSVTGGSVPNGRTWTYTLPAGTTGRSCVDSSTTAAVAGVRMMAVGVSAAGDALATNSVLLVP